MKRERPYGGMTNDDLYAAITALGQRIVTPERMQQVELEVEALRHEVVHLTATVARSLEKEAKRDACPYRDDIVVARDHEERLDALERGHADLRVAAATADRREAQQAGATAGGVAATVLSVAFEAILRFGQSRGWW